MIRLVRRVREAVSTLHVTFGGGIVYNRFHFILLEPDASVASSRTEIKTTVDWTCTACKSQELSGWSDCSGT